MFVFLIRGPFYPLGGLAASPMVWRGVAPPAARYGAQMAYDSARGVAVLCGGESYTWGFSTIYGDTWEWDGSAWKEVSSNGVPARVDATLAYDSKRGVAVLFGGYDGSAFRGDTWEWDGKNWKQVATTGPAVRRDAVMAYDSTRGRTVLFGGKGASNVHGDTWEWDGVEWKKAAGVTDPGPGGLTDASMAFDSARGKTVLFGGSNAAGTLSGSTWEWDGTAWTQVASLGPSARADASMAFDIARGVTVLFGGSVGSLLYDTWEWNGGAWKRVSNAGASPRKRAPMVFDSARGRTVLFGGYGVSGTVRGIDDTWEWDGSAWKQMVATPHPSVRVGAAMVYDITRDRAVLFGGYGPLGSPTYYGGDTWEWDGSAWNQVSSTGPPGRAFAASAYDSARGRMVLFGGTGPDPGSLGDTWEWDGGEWKQFSVASPPARTYAAMAYDSARGLIILYGGLGQNSSGTYATEYGDTWQWDGTAWTRIATTGPSVRYGAAMVYDAARERIVLFGGGTPTGTAYGDTWEWDGKAWTRVSRTGPSARTSASCAYDSARSRTLLFGGWNGPAMLSLRDTWEWNGKVWSQVSMTGPVPRSSASMAYDSARNRTLLYGGGNVYRYYSDMWEWAPSATMEDPASALRQAGGLAASEGGTLGLYNVETGGASAVTVDIADAVRLARKAIGLDQNP